MSLMVPLSESEKTALTLKVARHPGETNEECVERLILEGMLPFAHDQEYFRLFAKGGTSVKSDFYEKSFDPTTVRTYHDVPSKNARPANGLERYRSWGHP